jgi:nucleotide-binding universal stress UspA family protein
MKLTTLPTIPRPSPRVRFKRILFATDLGAASAQAQAYAALLAHTLGCHLYVLHVEPGSGLSPRYEGVVHAMSEEATSSSNSKIEELERFFLASAAPYTLLREQGEVHEAVNRVVDQYAIDLVILGSHGRHGVSYLFTGSTAENVTRSMTCPVITVGPQACSGFESLIKTIIFPTDFSEESKLALPYATSLAQEFHADLTVLHVAPKYERLVRDREHVQDYLLNQLKNLAPASRFPWCTVNHAVTFGDPGQEIPKAARARNADLIVLGLHTAVHFTSHLPERLSYKVLCYAPCPVMSVLFGERELKLARIPTEFLAMAPYVN